MLGVHLPHQNYLKLFLILSLRSALGLRSFQLVKLGTLSAKHFMSSGLKNLLVHKLSLLEMVVMYLWKWQRRLSRLLRC